MYDTSDYRKINEKTQEMSRKFKEKHKNRDANVNWKFFTCGPQNVIDEYVPMKTVKGIYNLM